MAGRPRKNTLDESLALALQTFWERGYADTSIRDLSAALGVGPSSIYNSFGSKDQLFAQCLEAYASTESSFLTEALALPDVTEALRAVLTGAVSVYTRADRPKGCAVLNADVGTDGPIDMLRQLRQRSADAIEARVRSGIADGQLPDDTDVPGLVGFMGATLSGMSQQARRGASEEHLRAVALRACRAL